jgi:GTP-binding protein EngB required for normal cell division/Arc/MetJ-type ribon-helix-helix transcriptional regulator
MTFKDRHKQLLVTSFTSIHEQLVEMEAKISDALHPTAFSRHVNDLSPTDVKVIHDYLDRLRSVMQSCLEDAEIPITQRSIGLRWALQTAVNFIHISIAEMSPNKLAGYGALGDDERTRLVKMQEELQRVTDRISGYLKGHGANFGDRIARLESTAIRKETLSLLDEIITRWQLVEFRSQLDMIIDRLAKPQFEIAVFGRVSSGKSSLLNHIAGKEILPVGVTPVTAVPTRLTRGDQPQVIVSIAEFGPREVPLDNLYEYAAEEGNPGNQKHVTNILVRVPSERLREGIVFVDTPGIGALATTGGAETLAYLPRCDLGVVLIDAGSSLAKDDLQLLRLLAEAGASRQVLISKADLLQADDRKRAVAYVRDHLSREFAVEITVRPVSTVGSDERLLIEWFENDILALYDRHDELRQRSFATKVVMLIHSVHSVLHTLHERASGQAQQPREADIERAKELLDFSGDTIREARKISRDWVTNQRSTMAAVLDGVTQALQESHGNSPRDAVAQSLREAFKAHASAAYDNIANLQRHLGQSLDSLKNLFPSAAIDAAAVSDLQPAGLPLADNPAMDLVAGDQASWWTFMPKAAGLLVRRSVEKRLGEAIRQRLDAYDRQLQSWLSKSAQQVIDRYENQAEVIREELRRAVRASQDETVDTDALCRDLDALDAEAATYRGDRGQNADDGRDGNSSEKST